MNVYLLYLKYKDNMNKEIYKYILYIYKKDVSSKYYIALNLQLS